MRLANGIRVVSLPSSDLYSTYVCCRDLLPGSSLGHAFKDARDFSVLSVSSVAEETDGTAVIDDARSDLARDDALDRLDESVGRWSLFAATESTNEPFDAREDGMTHRQMETTRAVPRDR